MRQLGLLNVIQNNPAAGRLLKMCMVLPLLPAAHIVEGLRQIETGGREANVDLTALFRYIRRYVF